MQKTKKPLALLLCVVMLVSLITGMPLTAAAGETYWDELVGTAQEGKDYNVDTNGDYTVTTALGLAKIASIVNGGDDLSGKTVTLENDIDLGAYFWIPIGRWVRSGESETTTQFNGTFDGNGKYILNMRAGNPADPNYNNFVTQDTPPGVHLYSEGNGLFGEIGAAGIVKDLGVINAVVFGARRSGGIAGRNEGTIQNCMTTGEVKANGTTSVSRTSGGIAGQNIGTIINCYSNAHVIDTGTGGIAGGNDTGATIANSFFTGYADSNFSGSIAGTNNGTFTDCYYLELSSKSEQTDGHSAIGTHAGTAINVGEFGINGVLKSGGDLLTALNTQAFKKLSGGVFPVLSWENEYKHETVAPVPGPEPEPTVLTITSADGYFDKIELSMADLEKHKSTGEDYVMNPGGGNETTYTTVEGILLSKLLAEYVPYGTHSILVDYGSTRAYFYPQYPEGNQENPYNYSSVMLLWSGSGTVTGDGENQGNPASIVPLRFALNGGTGQHWWSGVEEIKVSLPLSTVTVETGDASVTIKDSKGKIIQASAGGEYTLVQGETYSYSATATGYIGKTGTFTPDADTETVEITLTQSGGGTGGDTSYTITGYSCTNGTVTPNKTTAKAGETVTLNVTPAEGYGLTALSVSGASIAPAVSSNVSRYTFTMPSGNASVTASFGEIVLTLNSQRGTAAPVKAAIFTKQELDSLAQTNASGWGYLFYRNEAWSVIAATKLVTLTDLFNAGGINSYWRAGSYLAFTCSDGIYDKSFPDYSDISKCRYYMDDTAQEEVPAGIAITWESGSLAESTFSQIAQKASDSGNLRFVYGVSQETFLNKNAAGARSPHGVLEVTLIYEAPFVPGGSVGTSLDTDTETDPDEDSETDSETEESTPESISVPFTDLSETDWFYDAVAFAYERELFSGVSETEFSPNSAMTRASLVTVLYRLEDNPQVSENSSFTDVSEESEYYYNPVIWASGNNIAGGYSDSYFGAGDDITREQMITILYRYAQYKEYDVSLTDNLSEFSDNDAVSDWAQSAMAWAVASGIIKGSDGMLSPQDTATRAQVAAILQRFLEKYE